METKEYTLAQDFRAPLVVMRKGQMMSYKSFKAGQKVQGYIHHNTEGQVPLSPSRRLIIVGEYAIPMAMTKEHKQAAAQGQGGTNTVNNTTNNSKTVNVNKTSSSSTTSSNSGAGDNKPGVKVEQGTRSNKIVIPAEYREQMEKIKNTNLVGTVINRSRNCATGMLVGAGVGLLVGIFTRSPKLLCMVLGATTFGAGGYLLTKDAKPGEKKKTDDGKKD